MYFIWSYVSKYKKILFLGLGLAAINQFFSLLDPQILRILTDKYASNPSEYSKEEFLSGVALLLMGFVGVAFISRIAKNFQDYFVNMVSQRSGAAIYSDGIAHSLSLPYGTFEDQRSGELLLKLQKARTDIQLVIVNFVNVIAFSFLGILFVLTYAFYVNWIIGLVYSLMVPILGVTTFLIGRRIKAAQTIIVSETASLAGSTTETIRNVELVKGLGLESQEIKRLNAVNDQILNLELKKIKLIRLLSFIQGTMINALRAVLLFLMIWMIFRGSLTLGEFLSLFIYSFFIFSPLSELGNVSSQFHEARASAGELRKIMNMPPDPKPANPIKIDSLKTIVFKDVTFIYSTASKPAIEKVSFKVSKGQTVAFVGPSGSGKTTIVKLLVGLYHPTSGKIFLNESDSLKIDLNHLRKKIGLVSQETQLFAGTIRENLTFVSPKATDKECLRAIEGASAMSIIQRGGEGLDTRIGEGGVKISGGERQRLAIARALLRSPDLLVFDEATSSLDSITEKDISRTIRSVSKFRPNLITVLVAHRLSTIAHAEKIFVLEKGMIIEEGSHSKLLKTRGLYSALWREQSSESS